MRMGKQTTILKVVYMDEDNLLLYACADVTGSARCARDAETVSGFTRSAAGVVSRSAMERGMKLCRAMCYEPGDFISTHAQGLHCITSLYVSHNIQYMYCLTSQKMCTLLAGD